MNDFVYCCLTDGRTDGRSSWLSVHVCPFEKYFGPTHRVKELLRFPAICLQLLAGHLKRVCLDKNTFIKLDYQLEVVTVISRSGSVVVVDLFFVFVILFEVILVAVGALLLVLRRLTRACECEGREYGTLAPSSVRLFLLHERFLCVPAMTPRHTLQHTFFTYLHTYIAKPQVR